MINVLRTHDTSPMTNEVLKEKTLVAVSTSPNSKFKFKMNDFQLAIIVVSFVSDRLLLPSEPSNAIDLFRRGRRLQGGRPSAPGKSVTRECCARKKGPMPTSRWSQS